VQYDDFVCFGWLVLNRLVSKRACLLHRDLPPKSQHQDLLDNQMKTDINTKAILLNSVPRSIHMVEEIADLLTEYVYDLVGDGLRTVVIVRDNDHEIRYLKDDLQREYSKEATRRDCRNFPPRKSVSIARTGSSTPVGERRALIDYHENACVIQIPYSESETILISVSRDAGRDLIEFIESCREIVREQS